MERLYRGITPFVILASVLFCLLGLLLGMMSLIFHKTFRSSRGALVAMAGVFVNFSLLAFAAWSGGSALYRYYSTTREALRQERLAIETPLEWRSADRLSSVDLPPGWVERAGIGGPGTRLVANHFSQGLAVTSSMISKDVLSPWPLANQASAIVSGKKTGHSRTAEILGWFDIGSHPGLVFEIESSRRDVSISMLAAFVETDAELHQISAWASQGRYQSGGKEALMDVIRSFRFHRGVWPPPSVVADGADLLDRACPAVVSDFICFVAGPPGKELGTIYRRELGFDQSFGGGGRNRRDLIKVSSKTNFYRVTFLKKYQRFSADTAYRLPRGAADLSFSDAQRSIRCTDGTEMIFRSPRGSEELGEQSGVMIDFDCITKDRRSLPGRICVNCLHED